MSGSADLTCLSWNLAMLARSQEAPSSWTQEHVEAEVRTLLLDWSPDVVLLQELPGIVPYVETHDMIRANPRSHSGNLAVLVGHHLLDEDVSWSVVEGCAVLTTWPDRDLTIANVHLAPGSAGTAQRLAQLQAIVEASPTDDLVILGDTNTRAAEQVAIEAMGLRAPRPPRPTWDGRRNPFNGPGGEFIAYFTRGYTAGSIGIVDQVVRTGGITVDGHSFHLSDHFALEVTVGRSEAADGT
ncbi:MAG: endonuclease/exonuclease/phosphatase family protein [Actinomycetota bacterium]